MNPNSQWSSNETLLLSYRAIFMSTQSLFLVVGALGLVHHSHRLVYLMAGVSFLMIWFIWFPVVRARHKVIDYYKFSTQLGEADRQSLCSEAEYVHDATLRSKANLLFGISTSWRTTRIKLDLYMPLLFSFVWSYLATSAMAG